MTTADAQLSDAQRYALKSRWHTPCYDKLSDLDWVDGFGARSHGTKIGVRVSDRSIIPMLQEHLPQHSRPYAGSEFDCVLSVILGGKVPGSRLRKYHLLYQNHAMVTRAHEFEPILHSFEKCFAISEASLAPRRVFLHAGVVVWNDLAIVIPGPSMSGKSTLVTELIKAGAAYYSDEYAVLDHRGRVYPYHKPIAMRPKSGGEQVDISPEQFGATFGLGSRQVGLVVFTEYVPGATWNPHRITPGQAVLGMLANSMAGQLAPRRVLTALEAVVENAIVLKSPRSEAHELAPFLLRECEKSMPILAA